MPEVCVGISDIAVYVPRPVFTIEDLILKRRDGAPRLEGQLRRAAESTGQRSFRFPHIWEDTATMAAQAAHILLNRNKSLDLARLRYLAVGTETTLDYSKPVAAYVEGMLHAAGQPVPKTLSTFQIQHACAGGTLGVLSVGALLALRGRPDESGLVMCSDIARYTTASTAEITQGAGAAAMLVENNPKLIELDLKDQGFFSDDVDDFFRPLGSEVARVKGGYSMHCYLKSLDAAFRDHCANRDADPAEVLRQTDLFVLHAPFRNMPQLAMKKLLARYLGLDTGQSEQFLRERGLDASVDPVSRVGNLYSGSLFLGLAFLLAERQERFGDSLVGKQIMMASYGSGNTMVVLSGKVAPEAPEIIRRWHLDGIWKDEQTGLSRQYDQWIDGPYGAEEYGMLFNGHSKDVPPGSFYLSAIRKDGYREYSIK